MSGTMPAFFNANFTEEEVSSKPSGWAGRYGRIESVVGAQLRGLNLRGLQAERAFLVNADLRGSDLTYANLAEANLRGARLRRAVLDSAILVNSDLRMSDLELAMVRGSRLDAAWMDSTYARQAEFSGSSMFHLYAISANFRYAHLDSCELFAVDLRDADLTYADLRRASITNVRNKGAIYSMFGADIFGIVHDEAGVYPEWMLRKGAIGAKTDEERSLKMNALEQAGHKAPPPRSLSGRVGVILSPTF